MTKKYTLVRVNYNRKGRPLGETSPCSRHSDATFNLAWGMYLAGMRVEDIQKELGIAQSTLSDWFRGFRRSSKVAYTRLTRREVKE